VETTTAAREPELGHVPDQEADLVERATQGDRAAFETLYRSYARKVYSLVFRLVGSAQEAEEVTQEAFYQAYRNLGGFEARSKFYTWMFRIATNVSLQHLKRQARRRRESALDDVPESALAPRRPGPEAEAECRALYRELDDAVKRLPPNQRAVLVLGPIQGHTYEQMAHILGTHEDVIKGRLHRARENLRNILKRATSA
jgi:RNA polymerase sigma-70 factor (ECF subfamily)